MLDISDWRVVQILIKFGVQNNIKIIIVELVEVVFVSIIIILNN